MLYRFFRRLRFLRALTVPAFAWLWSGQLISSLGDGAFTLALAWAVLLLTGSGTAMGLTVTAELLPRLLFLLLGGVAADRLPRRLILLWSDGGRGLVVLGIALLSWLHLLQLWHLVVLSLLFGIAAGFFNPAYRSIPPQLVDVERLPSANALTSLAQEMSLLLGPLLGAGLVALAGPASAFTFDGLTFVASACCLLAMPLPPAVPSLARGEPEEAARVRPKLSFGRQVGEVLEDLRDGWRFVVSAQWFWIGLPLATLGNIFFSGPLDVTLPKLVHDVYGTGAWLLGALGTALAVGSIIATFVVGQVARLPRRGTLAYLAVVLASLAEGVLGLPLPPGATALLACSATGLLGFGLGAFGIIWVTLMQELVPPEKLGRISSIDQLGAWALLPVGYVVAGLLTDSIGPRLVFLGASLANVLLAVIALSVPAIRRLE